MVFDGARAFEGVIPTRIALRACKRFRFEILSQATRFGRGLDGTCGRWDEAFDRNAELYIRPMYWAESGPAAV